jgi:hypothetical protein
VIENRDVGTTGSTGCSTTTKQTTDATGHHHKAENSVLGPLSRRAVPVGAPPAHCTTSSNGSGS